MGTTNNPFAALVEDEPEAAPTAEQERKSIPYLDCLDDVPSGTIFVYDLETVPDEKRFPRPVEPEKVVKPDHPSFDAANIIGMTIPSIKGKLTTLSERQLNELAEAETAGKNRVGVLDAIREQLQLDSSGTYSTEFAEWCRLAVNPFCCRIVALGIKAAGHFVTMTAKNEDEERHILATLWKHIDRFNKRAGYNIHNYDDMVLVCRSIALGVDAPIRLDRRKFGNSQAVDLMNVLFPGSSAQKLKDVCKYLGIVPPAGYEMDGSQVLGLIDAGEWNKVAEYVESDAQVEWELLQKLRDYLVL